VKNVVYVHFKVVSSCCGFYCQSIHWNCAWPSWSVKDFDGQCCDVVISGTLQLVCHSFISSFSLSFSVSSPHTIENGVYVCDSLIPTLWFKFPSYDKNLRGPCKGFSFLHLCPFFITLCLLVCCLKTQKLEYTKRYVCLWFCMGVKLGPWHWGRYIDWGCLRKGC
jgi:hypothetical protein